MAKRPQKRNDKALSPKKRTYTHRPFPRFTLEQSLAIPRSIAENNACKPYSRLSLAESIDRSPESTAFRYLITSSTAYGLTEGSYANPQIKLTELGLSFAAPKSDEEKRKALVRAAINIELFGKLYQHFDQHKIPSHENFKNTLLRDYDVEPSLVDDCINQFKDDGKFVGLIRQVAGSDQVTTTDAGELAEISETKRGEEEEIAEKEVLQPPSDTDRTKPPSPRMLQNPRVFITHGKNQEIVGQLKNLLTFGKFEPVIAQEHETTSKPVSDKVLEDMRSCTAGIIHIESEQELLDKDGKQYHKINENVLIEIGAAMALYKSNYILLVQKDLHLPSNLQGLYRCEYEGSKLDYEATMKLLKAVSEFK